MIGCDRAEEIVSMMLDGEAGEELRQQLTAHVAECESCRAYHAGQVTLDVRLSEALRDWKESLQPQRWAALRSWMVAAALAAAVLAAASAMVGYHYGSGKSDPAQPDLARWKGTVSPARPYYAETEKSIPVMEGLIWDREYGLHSARYYARQRIHTLALPDGSELQWATNGREVNFVDLEDH